MRLKKKRLKPACMKFSAMGFLFSTLMSFSVLAAEGISFLSVNGKTRVNVPTDSNGVAPDVFIAGGENGTHRSYVFATGKPAQIMSEIKQEPPKPQAVLSPARALSDFLSTELNLLRWNQNQQVVASIYNVNSDAQISVTALHALQDTTPTQQISQKWYGFYDRENKQFIDIAITSKDGRRDSILEFIGQRRPVLIGQPFNVFHLSLMDQTNDITISRSTSVIDAVSDINFYFRNGNNSSVGPQSSGAVIYDANTKDPLGIVSCLSSVNAAGPAQYLVKAISFNALKKYALIELNDDLLSLFKNTCKSYDGKLGGGD